MKAAFGRVVLMAVLILVASVQAWPQATGLTGKVTDPSGAVVAGAEVTLIHEGTGVTRAAKTDENGAYIFPQLSPGTYRIEVAMQGFKKAIREHLDVPVGLTTTMNVALEVGALAEEVIVEATSVGLNTIDASMGIPFSGEQVRKLPQVDLDPSALLSLQSGVTYVPGAEDVAAGGYAATSAFDGRGGSVNGSRSDQSNITLDGVDVNDPQFGYAFTSVLRSTQASLQEFRVTTTNYNADAGRSSAAQVQLETKSGTNNLHGDLYYGHRNEAFGANDFFLNRDAVNKPKLRRHVYGAALGGPVVKDRFFLFGNWEDLRHTEGVAAIRQVPSLAFRDGVVIYLCEDPGMCPGGTVAGLTGMHSVPAGHYGLTPMELANIDPLGIGPNLAAIDHFRMYPVPNAPGSFDRLNLVGFNFGAPIDNLFHTFILRADANIDRAAKHTVYWRGNLQDDALITSPQQFPGLEANQTALFANKGFALGYRALATPSVVNTFRWGFTRIKETSAGLQNAEFVNFRFIDNLEGYHPDSFGRTIPQHHFRDDLSWVRGKHTFTFGGEARFTRNAKFSNANSFHFFTHNPSWLPNVGRNVQPGAIECTTAGCGAVPAVADAGASSYRDSVVNLLGIITQASAFYNFDRTGATLGPGEAVRRRFAVDEYEWYFQDQWKVTPNLTLSYGLRYFLSSPPWETNGNQVSPVLLDPTTLAVVPGGLGEWFEMRRALMFAGLASNRAPQIGFQLGGPANNGPNYYEWDTNNWSPRVAVAWAPRFQDGLLGTLIGDGKTVIRGGYSLVHDRIGNGLVTSFDDAGSFGMSTSIDSIFAGCDEGAGTAPLGACPRFDGVFNTGVAGFLLPPSPGGSFPAIPPGAGEPGSFAITNALDNTIRTPKAHMINFSIARRLPGDLTIEAAYVGRRGRNLLTIRDLAMPADLCDPLSSTCYFSAAQQLIGLFEAGQDILGLAPIPYWENQFASFGPMGINGGFLVCDLFGVDPGGMGGFSATQVAYDLMNCVHPDTTVFPFLVDQFGFPGPAADGDFAFFDDQFATLTAWSSIGRSEYHAFQLQFRKRFSRGFGFDLNYTLAKSLDVSSTPERAPIAFGFFTGGYSGSTINAWEPDLEYSFSDFDMRHQINANWIVDLPFGHGRRYGSDVPGWANHVLGGWSFSGIFRWNSRLPANVINARVWPTNWNLQGNATCQPSGGDPFGTQTGPCPPTQNTNSANGGRGPNLFQDPDAAFNFFRFTLPGQRGQRNVLRADGYYAVDLGLGKTFQMPWSEGHRFSFRWDMFNVTNSPYFDAVSLSSSIGSFGTFGDYSSVMGKPRRMQFMLRYEF